MPGLGSVFAVLAWSRDGRLPADERDIEKGSFQFTARASLTFWVISDYQETIPAHNLPSGSIYKYQGGNVGDAELVPEFQLEKRGGGEAL